MSVKSKKKDEKYSSVTLILAAGLLLVYFFYMKTRDEIINYPTYINYILFFSIICSLFLFHFNKFKIEFLKLRGKDLYLYITINLAKNLVVAWFLVGLVLIPFNYYNIHTAKGNSSEIIKCEIKGVSTYSKNRKVFFSLNGKTNVMYDFIPIMEDIKDNGKYKDYYFVTELRKGLLGSYILEGWDIQKK